VTADIYPGRSSGVRARLTIRPLGLASAVSSGSLPVRQTLAAEMTSCSSAERRRRHRPTEHFLICSCSFLSPDPFQRAPFAKREHCTTPGVRPCPSRPNKGKAAGGTSSLRSLGSTVSRGPRCARVGRRLPVQTLTCPAASTNERTGLIAEEEEGCAQGKKFCRAAVTPVHMTMRGSVMLEAI
jgi:hypothetical protein